MRLVDRPHDMWIGSQRAVHQHRILPLAHDDLSGRCGQSGQTRGPHTSPHADEAARPGDPSSCRWPPAPSRRRRLRDCWAIHVSDRFDESRMLVTEKVFGFPIAAIAAQLIFDGASAELIAPVKHWPGCARCAEAC
jgi:hypothetical protein